MAARKTGISADLLIHPGETIADILKERNITQAELATRAGVSAAHVCNVISGKKDISAGFAMGLEYALGVPKSFWLNLQANYDAELLELNEEDTIRPEEKAALSDLEEVVQYLQSIGRISEEVSPEQTILALRRILQISNIVNLKKVVPGGTWNDFSMVYQWEECTGTRGL